MPQRLEIPETVAFGIVGLPFQQRRDQLWDIGWVHLVIAVYFDDDLCTQFERFLEPGQHGSAHALILLVSHQDEAPVTLPTSLYQL